MGRIQKEAAEEQKRYSTIPSNKVMNEVVEIDEFGNKKIIQKLVDSDGPKQAPESKNLRASTITVIDSNGNEIQKSIFIDDQGNIIDESDIDYKEESYTITNTKLEYKFSNHATSLKENKTVENFEKALTKKNLNKFL